MLEYFYAIWGRLLTATVFDIKIKIFVPKQLRPHQKWRKNIYFAITYYDIKECDSYLGTADCFTAYHPQ